MNSSRIGLWGISLITAGLLFGGCSNNGGGDDGGDDDVGGACTADSSSPITIGGVFTVTKGGSADTQATNKDQFDLIINEVNNGCGTVGDDKGGATLTGEWRDGEDDASVTPGLVTELAGLSAAFIVGAGGSAPTTPAADAAVDAGVPFGAYFATGDSLTGCTTAELADGGITKMTDPAFNPGVSCWDHQGLFFRTATLSTIWGATAAKYAVEETGYSTLTTAAVIYRNDSFGQPIEATFAEDFVAAGGGRTVTAEIGYATGATQADFETHIPTLVADNPNLIVGVWRIGELKAFMEAYVNLRDNPGAWTKPSNYDTIRFIHTGSVRTDYTTISPSAIAAMNTQATGLEPYWNPESTGFQRWLAAYEAFDPAGEATVHTQMRTYDALMILTLAMVKADSTAGSAIAAELQAVANPPGDVVYPGEYAKARELIIAGTDINYEGASGPVDLDETGNVSTTPYQVWGVGTDGASTLIKAYASAE